MRKDGWKFKIFWFVYYYLAIFDLLLPLNPKSRETDMSSRILLARSGLFKGLPAEQLAEIEKISIQRQYKKTEAVFFEGDAGDGFYMVVTGKVKIFKISPEGKEYILHISGPGEMIAEAPVFHGHPFPANAETLVESSLLFFPRDLFVQLVHKTPSIAINMLGSLSMRLRRFANQIEGLSLKEVPARLAGYLLYLMDEQNGQDVIELGISKGQLASLLGTIPETLSRILTKMSKEGLIEVEGRTIRIVDKDALAMK